MRRGFPALFLLIVGCRWVEAVAPPPLELPGQAKAAPTLEVNSVPLELWSRPRADVVYDVGRKRTVIYGPTITSEWDGVSWYAFTPPTSPTPRVGQFMAYDLARQRVILFGGRDERDGTELADLWEWDGTTWSQR